MEKEIPLRLVITTPRIHCSYLVSNTSLPVYFVVSRNASIMTDALLSGVGCYHPTVGGFAAPTDRNAELSIHDNPSKQRLFRKLNSWMSISEHPNDGILLANAFLLHCACWDVLVACNDDNTPSPVLMLKLLVSFKGHDWLPDIVESRYASFNDRVLVSLTYVRVRMKILISMIASAESFHHTDDHESFRPIQRSR